jgi:hypothetical protein
MKSVSAYRFDISLFPVDFSWNGSDIIWRGLQHCFTDDWMLCLTGAHAVPRISLLYVITRVQNSTLLMAAQFMVMFTRWQLQHSGFFRSALLTFFNVHPYNARQMSLTQWSPSFCLFPFLSFVITIVFLFTRLLMYFRSSRPFLYL